MNPEFKAYIEAVVNETEDQNGVAQRSGGVLRRTFSILRKAFSLIADLLEIGPYYCELRPIRRTKGGITGCCLPKEAIGYHGLV